MMPYHELGAYAYKYKLLRKQYQCKPFKPRTSKQFKLEGAFEGYAPLCVLLKAALSHRKFSSPHKSPLLARLGAAGILLLME